MRDSDFLADRFETHRAHLRAVAFRMLGSASEADDAVQEAWIRLSRAETSDVDNLGGWLTTVVSRVCLDMLRSRESRREEPLEPRPDRPISSHERTIDPEQEAQLAESVGLALLVVLETLSPAERLAFVLHDMFAVPFEEIASIVGRSPDAARQLASRARRRVRGAPESGLPDLAKHRQLVDTFVSALRAGDLEALLAVLDPEFVMRADAAVAGGSARETRGARAWASQAIGFARGLQFTQPALVDGEVGLVFAPRGKLVRVLRFTMAGGKIAAIEVIGDRERLQQLEIAVL